MELGWVQWSQVNVCFLLFTSADNDSTQRGMMETQGVTQRAVAVTQNSCLAS